jgi:HEPN domain-containing protein
VFDDADAAAWWWSIALGDLNGARALAAAVTVPPRHAAALAHQAAEKALKAVVSLEGAEPTRTHDLVALAASLRGAPEIQRRTADLRRLTNVAITSRYPDRIETDLDWAAVQELIELASSITDQVRTILESAGIATSAIDEA